MDVEIPVALTTLTPTIYQNVTKHLYISEYVYISYYSTCRYYTCRFYILLVQNEYEEDWRNIDLVHWNNTEQSKLMIRNALGI